MGRETNWMVQECVCVCTCVRACAGTRERVHVSMCVCCTHDRALHVHRWARVHSCAHRACVMYTCVRAPVWVYARSWRASVQLELDGGWQHWGGSRAFPELGELGGESGWGWAPATQSGDLQAGRGGALGSSERGREEWERARPGTLAGRCCEE